MKEYIVCKAVSSSSVEDKNSPITPNGTSISIIGGYNTYEEAKKTLLADSKAVFYIKGNSSVDSLSINTIATQNGDEDSPREAVSADIELHPEGSARSLTAIHYEVQSREAKPLKGYVFYYTFESWDASPADDFTSSIAGPFATLEEAVKVARKTVALEEEKLSNEGYEPTEDERSLEELEPSQVDSDGTRCFAFHHDEIGEYSFYINTL